MTISALCLRPKTGVAEFDREESDSAMYPRVLEAQPKGRVCAVTIALCLAEGSC